MPEDAHKAPLSADQVSDAKLLLERLESDHRRFLEMQSPIKASVWIALLRDKHELIARSSPKHRDPIPAIVALGESLVLRALSGDTSALNLVAERIEGKIGLRKDDVDPDDVKRRADVQSVIEAVVVGLVNARLNNPGDDSIDVTPVDPIAIDIDNERQDRDTARRNELAGAARREAQDNKERGSTLIETNEDPEERDLTDPREGPRLIHSPNGQANGKTNGHG